MDMKQGGAYKINRKFKEPTGKSGQQVLLTGRAARRAAQKAAAAKERRTRRAGGPVQDKSSTNDQSHD